MDKQQWNRVGLTAAILLAPGGFILGATLAAKYWRQRAGDRAANAELADAESAARAEDATD